MCASRSVSNVAESLPLPCFHTSDCPLMQPSGDHSCVAVRLGEAGTAPHHYPCNCESRAVTHHSAPACTPVNGGSQSAHRLWARRGTGQLKRHRESFAVIHIQQFWGKSAAGSAAIVQHLGWGCCSGRHCAGIAAAGLDEPVNDEMRVLNPVR